MRGMCESNGTGALHLALVLLGVEAAGMPPAPPSSEGFVPPTAYRSPGSSRIRPARITLLRRPCAGASPDQLSN